MYFGTEPYGLEGHIEHTGSGANLYRGESFGQPRTLRVGDVLANGLTIAEAPAESYNGNVRLFFRDYETRLVAARIPLLLQPSEQGSVPENLRPGDILETGDVVLAMPKRTDTGVIITLTGGLEGHQVSVDRDLVIATSAFTYPTEGSSEFEQFVMQETTRMSENTLIKLARELGPLATERAIINAELYWGHGNMTRRAPFPHD